MPAQSQPYRGNPRLVRRWLTPLDDSVIALTWSPDGTAVAAATASGPISVLEASTGKPRWASAGHGLGTADLSWRHDGALLVTAGLDGKARLWDGATGEPRGAVDAGAGWAEHVLWHPTRDLFATAAGKKLRVWTSAGLMVAALPDHGATIADLAWRPRSDLLTSATHGEVSLWQVPKAEPVLQLTRQGPILALAWSPDGKRLRTATRTPRSVTGFYRRPTNCSCPATSARSRRWCGIPAAPSWPPTGPTRSRSGTPRRPAPPIPSR